jgi:hypothetical protein
MSINFEQISIANRNQCEGSCHAIDDFLATDWGKAMAGSASEVKKKIRTLSLIGDPVTMREAFAHRDLVAQISNELADTVLYADFLAQRIGLDLGECVRRKFNVVSVRVKSDVMLSDEEEFQESERFDGLG